MLPHVFMTRDTPWDPGKYDSSPSKDEKWYETKEEETYTHPGDGLRHGGDISRDSLSSGKYVSRFCCYR